MPIPSSNLQKDVNSYIMHDCDQLETTPSKISPMQLQTIAWGLRVAAPDLVDEPHILNVANAIDGLSKLGPAEQNYLDKLPK